MIDRSLRAWIYDFAAEDDNGRGYLEKFHDVAEIKQYVIIVIKYFL